MLHQRLSTQETTDEKRSDEERKFATTPPEPSSDSFLKLEKTETNLSATGIGRLGPPATESRKLILRSKTPCSQLTYGAECVRDKAMKSTGACVIGDATRTWKPIRALKRVPKAKHTSPLFFFPRQTLPTLIYHRLVCTRCPVSLFQNKRRRS